MMNSNALARSRSHRPGDSGGLPADGKADSIARGELGRFRTHSQSKRTRTRRGLSTTTRRTMSQVQFSFWLTLAGTGCWVACFVWMYRISANQNRLLERLGGL